MFYIYILKYFIDKEFWEGLYVVPILLVAKLLFGILFSLSIWYKVTDKTKYGILIAGIGALITVVLNIVLLPRIGYLGSAIASLLSYATMLGVSSYLSTKHYLIKYNFKKILFYFIIAFSMFGINRMIKIENRSIIFIINTVMLMSFIGIAYYKEKNLLKNEN